MKIIQDSREQTPLEFPYEFITEVEVAKLEVGDYACEYADGFRPPVIFERKALGDLFGTMGKGYARFKKEISKAEGLGIRLILIIEKPMSTVLKGYDRSYLSGLSIIRKLFTLWIKYDLTPVFCKDREECARYIYEFYCSIGRLKVKPTKPSKMTGTTNAKLPSVSGLGDIQTGRKKRRSNS